MNHKSSIFFLHSNLKQQSFLGWEKRQSVLTREVGLIYVMSEMLYLWKEGRLSSPGDDLSSGTVSLDHLNNINSSLMTFTHLG